MLAVKFFTQTLVLQVIKSLTRFTFVHANPDCSPLVTISLAVVDGELKFSAMSRK